MAGSPCVLNFINSITEFDKEWISFEKANMGVNIDKSSIGNDNKENSIRDACNLHVFNSINLILDEGDVKTAATITENLLRKADTENHSLDAELDRLAEKKQILLSSLSIRNFSELPISCDHPQNTFTQETQATLDSIGNETERLQMLKYGLEKILGIEIHDIENSVDVGMKLSMTIMDMKVIISLDVSMKLDDMKVISWFHSDKNIIPLPEMNQILPQVMKESKLLSPPQDLRHLLFTLSSIQRGHSVLQEDILHLRQSCLFHIIPKSERNHLQIFQTNKLSKVSEESNDNILVFQSTFNNGISCVVHIHPFYSTVPNSVRFESIFGIGGWDQRALEAIRNQLNMRGLRTLDQAFEVLRQSVEEIESSKPNQLISNFRTVERK